jgi:hypothetical protein
VHRLRKAGLIPRSTASMVKRAYSTQILIETKRRARDIGAALVLNGSD